MSKFSKVSLFSGLNNLRDITLEPRWSALCGYTDRDVDTVFAPELPGLDRGEIRRWYNGYNWAGEGVYNPFDVLLLFENREFRPYWFETGTPTFLLKLLAERNFFTPRLQRLQSSLALLSSFDVERIEPEALLFQTGYLTIHAVRQPLLGKWVYTLGYPNLEVETCLNEALLADYGVPPAEAVEQQARLLEILMAADLAALESLVKALFASIPHDWYRNNPLAAFEGHYASVFYSILRGAGAGHPAGGHDEPRAHRHGGAVPPAGVRVRVQGGGGRGHGRGTAADQGPGLRREIPGAERAGALDRHRVQPGGAQCGGVRGRDTRGVRRPSMQNGTCTVPFQVHPVRQMRRLYGASTCAQYPSDLDSRPNSDAM